MCTPINHSPFASLLSFILPYEAVLHTFFLSLILSHWLHRYLYNYFAAAIFSHFLFCFSFEINLTNIQFSNIQHMGRCCKNCYSSSIDAFLKNIHWVAIYIHTWIHVYVCINTHTHTHTHIYIYIYIFMHYF